jgi:hypothetical protein
VGIRASDAPGEPAGRRPVRDGGRAGCGAGVLSCAPEGSTDGIAAGWGFLHRPDATPRPIFRTPRPIFATPDGFLRRHASSCATAATLNGRIGNARTDYSASAPPSRTHVKRVPSRLRGARTASPAKPPGVRRDAGGAQPAALSSVADYRNFLKEVAAARIRSRPRPRHSSTPCSGTASHGEQGNQLGFPRQSLTTFPLDTKERQERVYGTTVAVIWHHASDFVKELENSTRSDPSFW